MTSETEIRATIAKSVSTKDIQRDSTLQSLSKISQLLALVNDEQVDSLVALGVGGGALTDAVGQAFEASEMHGIDTDPEALGTASKRGITVYDINLESDPLPFENDSIDLVVSFGLLEHLTWYDNVLSETERVLRGSGYSIFAMPNMAGWTNRLSLLTRHQPRNVEFSQDKPFGIIDAYDTDNTVGHVHTPTVSAFRELLEFHNFEVIDTVGLHPYQEGHLVALIDRLVDRRPSLCRRFAILSRYRSGLEQ